MVFEYRLEYHTTVAIQFGTPDKSLQVQLLHLQMPPNSITENCDVADFLETNVELMNCSHLNRLIKYKDPSEEKPLPHSSAPLVDQESYIVVEVLMLLRKVKLIVSAYALLVVAMGSGEL
ncbi:hypothetical protein GCK72_017960 [Caenorhabditis remanei]|uniref:Uncharacterized protein n=1 Tax=Caenorhabditis remanei TaxID=31234 RepID=A0A6A5G9B6_CAERE|nr:hypothetical protein GCK72_017960 [Caenorhabditis remanei]KAF1751406.1 hypothetical protein GCK72_017960 [Caenorhabditis remanei]